MYQIKQLSQLTGVSPLTIRYYERIGVLPRATRTQNTYRCYTDEDVKRLTFIRRARQLDFSLEHIAQILKHREQGTPPCALVQTLIQDKLTQVQDRIRDLEALRDELAILQAIQPNQVPPGTDECICPILHP
jgi:DNA-binding transcriptional MerR regulator